MSEEFNEKEGTKTLIKLDKKTSQPDLKKCPSKEERVVSEEEDFFDLFGNSPAEPQKEQETKKQNNSLKFNKGYRGNNSSQE